MQTLVWSVAMYGCESWTIKAADRLRDGHVQKDDANQLEGTQNQQLNNRGAAADMSFPGRSQTKEATALRPCSPS